MLLQRKLVAISALAVLSLAGSAAAQDATPAAPRAESRAFSLLIGGGSYLGVQTENVTRDNFSKYNLSEPRGVVITKVMENSPASQAGLREGDVVVRFDGEEIKSVGKLTRMISEVAPDQKARLTILRSGGEQEITVTVGKRPESGFREFGNFPELRELPQMRDLPRMEQMPGFPRDFEGFRTLPEGRGNIFVYPGLTGRRLGVSVSSLNKQLGDYFGIADGKGVLIEEVTENSPADRAGLRAGDVIVEIDGQPVTSQMDLMRGLNKKTEGAINLIIVRNKQRQTVNVTPENQKPAQAPAATKFKI